MFTPPSVNQIAKAYTGNAAPLNAKVEADKKQNGGIPKDLRQLMAAFDLAQGAQSMGNEQALQVPPNMPTIAQSTQERVRQMMQARPVMQAAAPQGLNALPTNVGEQYANGGIIGDVRHFTTGDEVIDPMLGTMLSQNNLSADDRTILEKLGILNPENRRANEKRERETQQREQGTKPEIERGRPKDPRASNNLPSFEQQLAEVSGKTPPKTQPAQPRVNADSAPMPGGLKDLVPAPDTEALSLIKKDMRRDPEAESQAFKERYMKEVGSRDLSSYDRAMQELETRKARLNGPKAGVDSVMDLLENIAQSKGRTWQAAGSEGAMNQKRAQQSRQTQQDELLDKILELGGKKSEAQFNEKKGMFEMTQAEKKSVYEKAYDAAKAVNMSDDKAKDLAAQAVQKELDRKNQIRTAQIGAQDRDQLMGRAKALMAANPKLTLEQAMQKSAEIAAAGTMESADVRRQQNFETGIAKIDAGFPLLQSLSMNPQLPAYIKMKAERDQKVKEYMQRQNAGGQGIDTLPTSVVPPGVTVTKVK